MINTDLQTAIPLPMDQIVSFCEKWAITRFELFGSILRKDFDPLKSDIDVMITANPSIRYGLTDYIAIEDELASLFGRQVDVCDRYWIERSENRFLRTAILRTAKVVYES
jgi:predicted nucleotidyltransferase